MRTHRNSDPRYERLGLAVRTKRKAMRLTQADVAALAGCAELLVRELEAGKPTLRLSKVVDVLEALGLRLRIETGRGGLGDSDAA